METYLKTYLTKKERDYLKMKARNSKLTESEYVRQRLAEATPLPFPKYDWEEAAEEIREIGKDFNELVSSGNTFDWFDRDAFREYAHLLDERFSELEAFANSLPPRPKTKPARIDDRFANKKYFHVRCTQSEKDMVYFKASYTRMTVSAYIRAVVMGDSPNQKPPAAFFKLRYQLTAILNNLNQLVGIARRRGLSISAHFYEDFSNRYHDFMQKVYG